MFRSGTSIVTNIIHQLGLDIGPEEDLLHPIGFRADLNPDGFYENFLMMEWSIHIFNKLNSWGDKPPKDEDVKSFDLNTINYKEFVFDAIVNMHDDRISNKNKSRILQKYYPGNLQSYFYDCFNRNFAVKNPHFMLLYPILDNYCPNSKYLIVFRNPIDTVKSAKKVTPRASMELYYQYYSRMIDHPNAIFFDYDELIFSPNNSLERLKDKLELKNDVNRLIPLIKKVSPKSNITNDLPDYVLNIYTKMKSKSINSSK
jgi:hypothetical protein